MAPIYRFLCIKHNHMPKYPQIKIRMPSPHEENANAFVILGKVRRALKNGGVPDTEIEKFSKDATAGNYDHLIRTCGEWVTVV